MRLVSFDALRVLGYPNTAIIKPESVPCQLDAVLAADWLLFPEYWQVNGLVFGLHKAIFPSLPTYLIGHDKIEMTRAFELVAPLHTPFTLITANEPLHAERLWDQMTLPFVAKLPRSSMGEGVWLIESREDWRAYLQKTDVLYVQEWLPIDRDVRVVWVGDRVIAAYWRLQSADGFHNNVARGGAICLDLVRRRRLNWWLPLRGRWGSIMQGLMWPWSADIRTCSNLTGCSAPRAWTGNR